MLYQILGIFKTILVPGLIFAGPWENFRGAEMDDPAPPAMRNYFGRKFSSAQTCCTWSRRAVANWVPSGLTQTPRNWPSSF